MPRRKAEAAGRTDWAALRGLSEDEIEAMAAADPDNPATDEAHWAGATFVAPLTAADETATEGIAPGKTAIRAHFDRDIVDFFRRGGRDYQARMNAVLRRYVDAQGGGTER